MNVIMKAGNRFGFEILGSTRALADPERHPEVVVPVPPRVPIWPPNPNQLISRLEIPTFVVRRELVFLPGCLGDTRMVEVMAVAPEDQAKAEGALRIRPWCEVFR